jgi:hypothetical protein
MFVAQGFSPAEWRRIFKGNDGRIFLETSDHVEALVDVELENPLTFFEVVGEAGRPVLSQVSVKVFVASPHDQDAVRRLWSDTLQRLPLVRTGGPL